MKSLFKMLTLILWPSLLLAKPLTNDIVAPPPPATITVHEITYSGKLSQTQARFAITLDLESTGSGTASLPLIEGEVAVLPSKLPESVRLTREGNLFSLSVAKAGRHEISVECVARIDRQDLWNQVSFTGPAAAIGSVSAQAEGTGVEIQLLTGTTQEAVTQDGVTRVKGFLGAERKVSLRWKSKTTDVARQALLTCETRAAVQVAPTVIKYKTDMDFDILQGSIQQLKVTLPGSQALTKLQGEGVRDWNAKVEGDHQVITVEFIKPMEKSYKLALFSEQSVEGASTKASIQPPQPTSVERENGTITVSAEDVLAVAEETSGLRQANAPAGTLACYQFYGRAFTLSFRLQRLEPVISTSDRVTLRVDEARALVTHALGLTVEKAGIYVVEMAAPAGFVVADVRGDGIEDWKVAGGKLAVNFSSRILGSRKLEVQLEGGRAPGNVTATNSEWLVTVAALRVTGASRETTQIGAASAPGIQLKTVAGKLGGSREISTTRLSSRTGDETLAFAADQPDWTVTVAAEHMAPRITADVFNVITIGDGLLGGSATIRYAIINQGVQEFHVQVPPLWKNVEFTGPNIRRKELQGDTWVIGLQEKAWGGYTLVVTYDYQFDPHRATLPIGGIHPVRVERETGSIAITSAANLRLAAQPNGDAIRRVDESDLPASDRALITRPVLMAYKYQGGAYGLGVDVTRFDELAVLDAAADRTQLTTVLTEEGQMLSQASFMVKNNDRQFQTFNLPEGADFWGCYVDGQPVKPEKNGTSLLVPLPRHANRDEAFAVDIVYAQKISDLKSVIPRTVTLTAPLTDMQTTYAEWELYAPPSRHLARFAGNMIVARGTTYGLRDAWDAFIRFYDIMYHETAGLLWFLAIMAGLVFLILYSYRRGWRAFRTALVVFILLGLFAGMLTPALSVSREKARRCTSANNLKQIGLSLAMYADQHAGQLPGSLDELKGIAGDEAIFRDVSSGDRFIYLGAGRKWQDEGGRHVLAYSPREQDGGRNVLFSDGSVQWISNNQFNEALSGQYPMPMAGPHEIFKEANAEPSLKPIDRPITVPGALPFQHEAGASQIGAGSSVAALVSGLRPIRIEIPKTGTRYVFTKVLNVGKEPLTVKTLTIDQKVFNTVRGLLQALALLAGLVVLGWQLRKTTPSTFTMTAAVALIIGSIIHLLISLRALDTVMIIAAPLLALAGLVWLVRKIWKRAPAPRDEGPSDSGEQGTPTPPALPTVTAALLAALFLAAPAVRAADSGNVTIQSASYTGMVQSIDGPAADRVVQMEAVFSLESSEPNQTVRLFGPEVAVKEFSGTGTRGGWWFGSRDAGTVQLVRDGKNISVRLSQPGKATARIKYLVKLGGDVAKRQIAFGIPPALASRLAVVLDEPGAMVELPAAVSFTTTPTGNQQTLVEAVLGASDRVDVLWTPRMKRAAEIATTVFCRNTALVSLGGGVLNVRSLLDYQVTQGELRQLQVTLPAGQRLMRVEGEAIRTWKLDGQTLSVELAKGMTPDYRLTLETEKPDAGTPLSKITIEIPHAADVKRETGLVALKSGEEYSLDIAAQQDIQKVDTEEYVRATGAKGAALPTSAYRFLKPGFALTVTVAPVQAQLEAVIRDHLTITPEQLALRADVGYTIKRAGVFSLRVSLPDGFRVERVDAGTTLSQWQEKAGAKPGERRVLELTLKERTQGDYPFSVHLVKSQKGLAKSVAVEGLRTLDTQKETAFVTVSAEDGIQIKSDSFAGLTEIPAAMVPAMANRMVLPASGILAFKVIPGEREAEQAGWKLSVATEQIESWIRAEIMNTISLTETLASGRSVIRYDVANSPTREFRVRIPAALRNVEVTGSSIRRKDFDAATGEWRVELQNKVRGQYTLTVTWDLPWNVKNGTLELMGIEAAGVERETGWLSIMAPPGLKLDPRKLNSDLLKADARDLPEWAAPAGDSGAVLVFRYLRPGFKLALAAQRFEEAEVLQALVDRASLTTVVAEDGQLMTEMSLSIRNNGRQYLEVTLPPGAQVWGAFVGGQPVRPSRRDGAILLPLERSAGETTVQVELTYVGGSTFPKRNGVVSLVTPGLDIPLKNAQWNFYLPPDYRYDRFEGTMKPMLDQAQVAATPAQKMFSMTEYIQEEDNNRKMRDQDVVSSLSNARSQLKGGNNTDAYNYYQRAKGKIGQRGGGGKDELKELEKDLKRSQALNLVNAQQTIMAQNGSDVQGWGNQANQYAGNQVLVQQTAQQRQTVDVQYDQGVAELQWEKVSQAQEIAATKIMPLRINLPKRGLRYTFTQVLQTEIGKPMVVEFRAVNQQTTGWQAQIAWAAACLLVLWAVVAVLMRRKA
jgi:type II secretory pathway pseudopilin PulG